MPKKQVRIIITGKPRSTIDVSAMVQIIIAFGRELAARNKASEATNTTQIEVSQP